VTRPLLPSRAVYARALKGIWERQWLTNSGALHDELERALADYLGAPWVSLVNNGTTALMLALRAMTLDGEVITTPLTAPATVDAIRWCGLEPVFADIEPKRLTLDPEAVEAAITPQTAAIVGVHIFGIACDVERLGTLATRHGLRLVYDGAHAFGTRVGETPVTAFGDATALSFHATKLFTTAEGGAVVGNDAALKTQIDRLRNFGTLHDFDVVALGLNGKMSEFHAALGLANLPLVDEERRLRQRISSAYIEKLSGIEGLGCPPLSPAEMGMLQYFPVRIDTSKRDTVYEGLKRFNVFARKYFQPMCSQIPLNRELPSSAPANLPGATLVSGEILCLPFFGELGIEGAHRVAGMVRHLIEAS
jgi:dTDP-4-amino-4,6-dideoxygalactose transaminase